MRSFRGVGRWFGGARRDKNGIEEAGRGAIEFELEFEAGWGTFGDLKRPLFDSVKSRDSSFFLPGTVRCVIRWLVTGWACQEPRILTRPRRYLGGVGGGGGR